MGTEQQGEKGLFDGFKIGEPLQGHGKSSFPLTVQDFEKNWPCLSIGTTVIGRMAL